MITISLDGGRKQKLSAGHILGALTAKGGIPGSAVGKIDRQDNLTFLAVQREYGEKAFAILKKAPIKGVLFTPRIHD